MNTEQNTNIMTVSQVATLTGMSKQTIYHLTHTRQIPYYKPSGKLLFFKREEVEAWLLRNRVNTAEETERAAAKRNI